MNKTFLGALAIAASVGAFAAPPANEKEALSVEIARLLVNLHWRNMIAISLQRGDIQSAAMRTKGITEAQSSCVRREYNEDALMALVATSYERVYSSSQVVADVNAFVESTGGQKIIASIAEQAKLHGARVAAENLKPELVLSPQEMNYFDLFAASTAGREYLEARRRLPPIQRELLAGFAAAALARCGVTHD